MSLKALSRHCDLQAGLVPATGMEDAAREQVLNPLLQAMGYRQDLRLSGFCSSDSGPGKG